MAIRPLPSVLVALGPSASAEPDADLLARYVSTQDDTAFALLVRRYARLVWRVARTRCRSESTAEDVFQAAFVVLARKAGSIRTGGALPGWLHRTAHRIAVKAAGNERPTSPFPTDTPVSADPLDALTARELLAAVNDEIAKLSDAERSVLVLCGIDHTSLEDAATRLGWSVNSAKGRLERARAKLRTRLDARGLALPAVVLGLLGGPSAATVQAALSPGRAVSPVIEHRISEAIGMKTTWAKATLAAGILGGLLFAGGWATSPHTMTVATAAPVPKREASPVVWSEFVKVDWQASRVPRVAGVWTSDGKSVLVPRPMPQEKDSIIHFGGVDIRDADSGLVTKTLNFEGKMGQAIQPTGVQMSPDGRVVYAAGAVYTPGGKGEAARGVVTWKDVSKDDAPEVTLSADLVDDPIALSADGKQLAVVAGRSVELLDTSTGKALWRCNLGGGKRGPLAALAFNSADGTLAVGTGTGEWVALKVQTGQTVHVISDLGMAVRTTAASADGKNLAFGGDAVKGGQALMLFTDKNVLKVSDAVPAKVAINGLAFSPDGKHLVAACSDGEVRLFDVATGKPTTSAKEHKEVIFSVAYSPDGRKLLTVGRDAIKVWDVEVLMKAK